MTTPPPPKQTIHTICPACGAGHEANPEFGPYCRLSCLNAAMQGRIIPNTEHAPNFADRSQHHAS